MSKPEGAGFQVVSAHLPRCAPPRPDAPRDPRARAFYQEALAALQAGDEQAAEDALRRALACQETDPACWRELGILLCDQQRYDEAERPLERAALLDGGDHEVLRFRALCREKRGRVEEALEDYKAFLAACPPEHQKARLHAQARLEALEKGETGGPPPDAAALGVEELERLPRTGPSPAWAGAAALAFVVLAWVGWGGGEGAAPDPGGKGPRGPSVERVAELAARTDAEGRHDLARVVMEGYAATDRAGVDAAIDALAARGDREAVEVLVRALAVVARPGERRKGLREHMSRLEAALRAADAELVKAAVAGVLAGRGPAQGPADARVEVELRGLAGSL